MNTFPEPSPEVLAEIAELHRIGDVKWSDGKKESSDWYHRQASELGKPFGLSATKCSSCGVYMPARDLPEHHREKHA